MLLDSANGLIRQKFVQIREIRASKIFSHGQHLSN